MAKEPFRRLGGERMDVQEPYSCCRPDQVRCRGRVGQHDDGTDEGKVDDLIGIIAL